jgi:DNA-binding MarR family transcriptional regulator
MDGKQTDCRINPESCLQLDRVIHERGRLAIVSLLAASPELAFTELREALQMTDGNLSVHIRTLQEAGYLAVTKTFQSHKSLTTCSLTPAGRKAFARYVSLLEDIVQQAKSTQ